MPSVKTSIGAKEAQRRALRELHNNPAAAKPNPDPPAAAPKPAVVTPKMAEPEPVQEPPQPATPPATPRGAATAALCAPPGECPYCDRRRAYAASAMRRAYKRKKRLV